jgi:hypothetical protein
MELPTALSKMHLQAKQSAVKSGGHSGEPSKPSTKAAVHWRQTFSYDQYGNMIDWITFDSDGKRIAPIHTERDTKWEFKQKFGVGKDDELKCLHTFDVETGVKNHRNFNEVGPVTLDWMVADGKLISFWGTAPSGLAIC